MVKQLIRYHIKQGIWPLACFILLAIFSYGFGSYTVINEFENYDPSQQPDLLQTVLVSPFFAGFAAILIAVFAILMLGSERGSGRSLILHALPFPKVWLFWIKWTIGVATLIVFPLIGFFASWLLLQAFGINPFDYVTLLALSKDFGLYLLFDVTILTIFLFAGTIAGDIIGQLLLGTFFLFLNYFTYFSVYAVALLGFGTQETDLSKPLDFLMTITAPFALLFQYENLLYPVLFNFALTIILLLFGSRLYVKGENERLGRFTIFPKLHPALIITFSIYTTILLAGIIGLISSENQFLYWLAIAILAWPTFSSYRRMIGWSR
ncbi:ABC transporter permease subunit [Exiguobacterium sp. TDN 0502]|uniref:ABC transporter permease subunit n=1 Tax=Exiguobacterium sp. TDN 0502 TaxID=3420731 RepID=UPI003D784653